MKQTPGRFFFFIRFLFYGVALPAVMIIVAVGMYGEGSLKMPATLKEWGAWIGAICIFVFGVVSGFASLRSLFSPPDRDATKRF